MTMDVLVVDDEKIGRDRLQRMVEKIEGFRVVGVAGSGEEGFEKMRELKPDIAVLDIRMPGMDGIELAHHALKLDKVPKVIFCSAYDDRAMDAYEAQAVSYLVKPAQSDKLEAALRNASLLSRGTLDEIAQQQPKKPEGRQHISSKTRLGVELVPVSEVRFFQADHKYVTAFHTKGETLIDDTLKELEQEFEGRFVRVHRNALVSVEHIEGMERTAPGQYCLRMQGIAQKPLVSRRHASELSKLLRQL
ncbi:MAG: response regulator transcription factor [Pseudomonadales bacterium]|nr:response regulator transcription factor [Pseudomonadales bacterium]